MGPFVAFVAVLAVIVVHPAMSQCEDTTLFCGTSRMSDEWLTPKYLSEQPIQPVHTENQPDYTIRRVLVAAGFVGEAIVTNREYMGQRWQPFRTEWKIMDQGLHLDKGGHMGTGYLEAMIDYELYLWSGFDEVTASWLAFGTSSVFHIFREWHEGFGPGFGFDPGDVGYGMLGASFIPLRVLWPWFTNVQLRWSFVPTGRPFAGDPNYFWIKDYGGQTNWLSVNLFPEGKDLGSWQFLKGLCIEIGLSKAAYHTASHGSEDVPVVVWLSLGLDLTRYHDAWWTRLLGWLKFPFPAVRIDATRGTPRFRPLGW